jgi:hypothetical protein
MRTTTSLKKLTTQCGQEFDKNQLEVLLFQPLSFIRSNTAFTYYRTQESEFIKCSHHYDAVTDMISMCCEKIPEKEAQHFLYQG